MTQLILSPALIIHLMMLDTDTVLPDADSVVWRGIKNANHHRNGHHVHVLRSVLSPEALSKPS